MFLQAIPLTDLPPLHLLTPENMFLWPAKVPQHRLLIHDTHGHAGTIWSAVILHEQGRTTASTRPTQGNGRSCELDVRPSFRGGAGPEKGGIVEKTKGKKRCTGKFAAGCTVAESDGDGKGAAVVYDATARAAAAEHRRRRRDGRLRGDVHEW